MTANNEEIRLQLLHRHETAAFAVQELHKYLQIILPRYAVILQDVPSVAGAANGLRLGLFTDFGLSEEGLADPAMDDAIHIDVSGAEGIIAGSNPRSLLIAVYRFLSEIGCAWVRPGADGESIPRCETADFRVSVMEQASYRYRGLCIEGAVSFENVRDNIEWAPKVGFNSYFLEFKTPFTFFDRWYSHRRNPYKEPEPVTVEQVDAFTEELGREISRRGLMYHAVGHGWTGEPLGLPCLGWDPVDTKVGEETSQYFALLDGKRELFHGVPLNTNLCYSNPEARRLIVQYAADYAEQHRSVNILHFWLADAFNNHCECEACRGVLPADFYVMLLNELDAEFTLRGLDAKIVFLLYLDLLWPPETERLHNKERFILLFAPISRSYSRTYEADTTGITLKPFVRNQLKFPSDIRENVAYLKAWQQFFDGDGFTYEYHFMWDHYYDPGYYRMAEMISADVKNLRKLGLNGMISDQTQRSFFPTGLGMYVMGRTLWNDGLAFDDLAKAYFAAAFGPDGERVRTYMARLSDLFDPPYLRGEHPRVNPEAAARLAQVPGVVEEIQRVIERNLDGGLDSCHAKSWAYVRLHGEIAVLLARAFELRAEGRLEEAGTAWEAVVDLARRQEDAVQPDFDVFLFIQTLNKEFQSGTRTHFGGEVT